MRIIWLITICIFLWGCPPKGFVLKHRSIQHVEAGLGIDGTSRIIQTDEEVDALAIEVAELLEKYGFELKNSSVSWGVQPLTGHTQNQGFALKGTKSVYCYVRISKKEFIAEFQEVETEYESNIFATTNEEKAVVSDAVAALSELAKRKFSDRVVRVSEFEQPQRPNKAPQPTQ